MSANTNHHCPDRCLAFEDDLIETHYLPDGLKRILCDSKSCGGKTPARSSYHQYKQLPLVDEKLNPDTLFKTVIFPNSRPCYPGTNNPTNHPGNDDSLSLPYQFVVNTKALNGWAPQSHMDCNAAAIAGGLNVALGLRRGSPGWISTPNAVSLQCRYEEKIILKLLNETEGSKEEKEEKRKQLVRLMVRTGEEDRRNHEEGEKEVEGFTDGAKSEEGSWANKMRKIRLMTHLRILKSLRSLEISAGEPDLGCVVQMIAPQVQKHFQGKLSLLEYRKLTWEQIKMYLQQPNTALLMHVPIHYVLVFAAGWVKGEEEEENRHLLVGRPSGGQSPCAWIPYDVVDKGKGERMWANKIDLKKENGGFGAKDPGLVATKWRFDTVTFEELPKNQPHDSGIAEQLSGLDYFWKGEEWREFGCKSCFVDGEKGTEEMWSEFVKRKRNKETPDRADEMEKKKRKRQE